MTTLFDYSNCIGYYAYFKSDNVKDSFVHILGTYPDEYKIDGDSLIEDYYFPNLEGYEKYKEMESLIPVEKIQERFLIDFRQDFDASCLTLKCYYPKMDLPDDLGKIPTLDELKNDIQYYKVTDFTFSLENQIIDKNEYKNKLIEYLKQKSNKDWNVYFNSNGSISCLQC